MYNIIKYVLGVTRGQGNEWMLFAGILSDRRVTSSNLNSVRVVVAYIHAQQS